MFALTAENTFHLYSHPTDTCPSGRRVRKSFDALSGLVRNNLGYNPTCGAVFIFINKRRDKIKLLHLQGSGYLLYYKRLEKGTFELPRYDASVGSITLSYPQMVMIIDKEVTDQLELVPARLFIKRFVRPKYIALTDESQGEYKGVIAELPVFPIEKGIAGPGLLAQIMVDKFIDHLPVYRQIERFKREGVKMSSSTINGWQESICNLLEPLYDTLKHRVLSQGYLQVDETPIPVLDKQKKGKTHRGYHWIYHSPLEKMALFDYNTGRSREGPIKLLRDFKGYLQTDGYNVYELFAKRKDITHVNCMAHARRGFEKSLPYDQKRAEHAMEMFQKLYTVEQKAREKDLSPEDRHTLRLDESLPVMNELGEWIVETYKTSEPKYPLGKATAYCIERWDNLLAFLEDGSLEIDNNLAENAIRPIALGRKNYLFAGSSRGAERAAMMYSFFGT